MTRGLIIAALTAGVFALSITVADARVTHHSCGSIAGHYHLIRVTNTTCKVARKLISHSVNGAVRSRGWSCKEKLLDSITFTFTCHHSGGEVLSYFYTYYRQ